MKRLLIVLPLLLASCSLFDRGGEESFDINGEWHSATAGAALLGECCSFDLTLFERDGRVTVNGEVITPGEYVGHVYINVTTGSGTWDGQNLSLSLRSGIRQMSLTAHLVDGEWYDMEADFAGLGYTLRNFGFFKVDPR